jgi:hypothetical protein
VTTTQHQNLTTPPLHHQNNMTINTLNSLARAAGTTVPQYIKVTLGIFEPKGTKGNRLDTAARTAIWGEAVKMGITTKQGVGDAQWDAFLKASLKTRPLRAVAPRLNDAFWNLSKNARLLSPEMRYYFALEEFTQEVLRRRRGKSVQSNDHDHDDQDNGKHLSGVVLSSLNDDC